MSQMVWLSKFGLIQRSVWCLCITLFLVTGCNQSPSGDSSDTEVDLSQPEPEQLAAIQSVVNCAVNQRFGRMFPALPAATWATADLDLLANKTMAAEEADPTPEGEVDDEENDAIDAGYTYVGQFIDHDLTLTNRNDDLVTPVDPYTFPNLRTPAFDLDSVYGLGPSGSSQLYQPDGIHLLLGAKLFGNGDDGAVDLPRDANGQAVLGDPRNDENRIVSGLHEIFLRFHNLMADRVAKSHPSWDSNRIFAQAQRQVRFHYQWAVLTDFLPTIVGERTLRAVLPSLDVRQARPRIRFYNPCTMNMPVEFSVAAYRFGHSMVRPIYRINSSVTNRLPVFSLSSDPNLDLGGFRPTPSNFAIDWSFFFQMTATRQVGRPQVAYRMDNSLVFPLSLLPAGAAGAGPNVLVKRSLLRAVQFGLPSGQDVARAMGAKPLSDAQILIGKATGEPEDTESITEVAPGFAGKAPLFTYILAEAISSAFKVHDGKIEGAQVSPMRLGPVGGRIVAETFVGLMLADRSSFLFRSFRPRKDLSDNGRFGFRELIKAVTH